VKPLTLVDTNRILYICVCYGLDGLGIKSQWVRDYPQLSSPALGPTQPPIQWVPDFPLM